MEMLSKALKQIQESMKELQAELTAKRHGYKLPGMEDDEEGEALGNEYEPTEIKENEDGSREETQWGKEKPAVPGSESPLMPLRGKINLGKEENNSPENMKNIFGQKEENEDDEEGEADENVKKSPKIMAIRALIAKPAMKK